MWASAGRKQGCGGGSCCRLSEAPACQILVLKPLGFGDACRISCGAGLYVVLGLCEVQHGVEGVMGQSRTDLQTYLQYTTPSSSLNF